MHAEGLTTSMNEDAWGEAGSRCLELSAQCPQVGGPQ